MKKETYNVEKTKKTKKAKITKTNKPKSEKLTKITNMAKNTKSEVGNEVNKFKQKYKKSTLGQKILILLILINNLRYNKLGERFISFSFFLFY